MATEGNPNCTDPTIGTQSHDCPCERSSPVVEHSPGDGEPFVQNRLGFPRLELEVAWLWRVTLNVRCDKVGVSDPQVHEAPARGHGVKCPAALGVGRHAGIAGITVIWRVIGTRPGPDDDGRTRDGPPVPAFHQAADRDPPLQLHRMRPRQRLAAGFQQGCISANGIAWHARSDIDLLGQNPRELDPAPPLLVRHQPRHQLGITPKARSGPRVDVDSDLDALNRRPGQAIDDANLQRAVLRVVFLLSRGRRRN